MPDIGTLVIGMRGPGPRVVLRVSCSGSFRVRVTCTIKAFVVSMIESSTYLLLINWRREKPKLFISFVIANVLAEFPSKVLKTSRPRQIVSAGPVFLRIFVFIPLFRV